MQISELDTSKLLYDISKQSEMDRLFKDVPAFANDEIIDAWLYRLGIARENYVESVIKKYC